MHNMVIVIFLASLNVLPVPFSLRQRYIKVNFKNQLLSPTRFNSVRKIIHSTLKAQKQVIEVTMQVLCVDIARIKTDENDHFFHIFVKIFLTNYSAHLMVLFAYGFDNVVFPPVRTQQF